MPYKNDEQHFIKEKIKDKPVNKKQLLQKGMATIGYAILFGFVSCLVFCALRPEIEKWFTPKEDQCVGIPKDTLSDEENAADTCADSEQEAADTNQKPKKEDKKQTVYITEKKDMTLDDYQVLQNELYQIGNKVNKAVVTVTGVNEGVDIFDSPYEATGQASGLIIALNKKELLILT